MINMLFTEFDMDTAIETWQGNEGIKKGKLEIAKTYLIYVLDIETISKKQVYLLKK